MDRQENNNIVIRFYTTKGCASCKQQWDNLQDALKAIYDEDLFLKLTIVKEVDLAIVPKGIKDFPTMHINRVNKNTKGLINLIIVGVTPTITIINKLKEIISRQEK